MRTGWRVLSVVVAGILMGSAFAGIASAQCPPILACAVVTNEDIATPGLNATSVFSIPTCNPNVICPDSGNPFSTTSTGLGGGYFAVPRQAVTTAGANLTCIFVGDAVGGNGAGPSDIAAFAVAGVPPNWVLPAAPPLFVTPHIPPDSGATFGLGIVIHQNFLYANYTAGTTDPAVGPGGTGGTIGVWQIGPGCNLIFRKSIAASAAGGGLNGGPVDGMTVTPKHTLVVAYADGSVGTYWVPPFAPWIQPVAQYVAAGFTGFGAIPVSVAVSGAGGNLWAIFDDFGGSALFDVFKVNDALHTLGPADTVYGPFGGSILDSNTFVLSPNKKYIYDVGTLSGSLQTETFNAVTGAIAPSGCADVNPMRGFGFHYKYLGIDAVQTHSLTADAGAGVNLYVAEASFGLSPGSFIGKAYIMPNGCLFEAGNSPQPDPASQSLLSISTVTGNPSQ